MESPAPDQAADDLTPAERNQDREMVSRHLGFEQAHGPIHRLLALADGLWQIRTPILVPVSITALLLFVLLPASPPLHQKQSIPLVRHFTEIHHLVSTDHTLRSTAGGRQDYQAVAGSLIFLRHCSTRVSLDAGDPVSVEVSDNTSQRTVLKAKVSENGLIEVPLMITRPGCYRIRLSTENAESPLVDLTCNVIPPSPPAKR